MTPWTAGPRTSTRSSRGRSEATSKASSAGPKGTKGDHRRTKGTEDPTYRLDAGTTPYRLTPTEVPLVRDFEVRYWKTETDSDVAARRERASQPRRDNLTKAIEAAKAKHSNAKTKGVIVRAVLAITPTPRSPPPRKGHHLPPTPQRLKRLWRSTCLRHTCDRAFVATRRLMKTHDRVVLSKPIDVLGRRLPASRRRKRTALPVPGGKWRGARRGPSRPPLRKRRSDREERSDVPKTVLDWVRHTRPPSGIPPRSRPGSAASASQRRRCRTA